MDMTIRFVIWYITQVSEDVYKYLYRRYQLTVMNIKIIINNIDNNIQMMDDWGCAICTWMLKLMFWCWKIFVLHPYQCHDLQGLQLTLSYALSTKTSSSSNIELCRLHYHYLSAYCSDVIRKSVLDYHTSRTSSHHIKYLGILFYMFMLMYDTG